jgi:hypothetical protein
VYSAVSRIWNPLRVGLEQRLAECNSAIQQIEDLRYANPAPPDGAAVAARIEFDPRQ